MKNGGVGLLGLFVLLLCGAPWTVTPSCGQALQQYRFSRPHMGTLFHIVLYAPDSLRARRAADAAFARIDTLNRRLSDYLLESEVNRLSATAGAGEAVPVGDDLWTVLREARRLALLTDGAFDVTVGPLTRLWRKAMRRGQRPPADELERALRQTGYRYLELDTVARTACLKRPGMRLDLGGIAKGFAVDEALAVLRAHGLPRALVDGGGDLRLGDPPPEAPGWRVALTAVDAGGRRHTEERLLSRTAVATSGATYRYVEVDGVRYSHLLDPRTGVGLTVERLVTVVAPAGMQADALASAFSVMDPDEAVRLASTLAEVAVRIVEADGEAYRQRQSPAFEAATTPRGDE